MVSQWTFSDLLILCYFFVSGPLGDLKRVSSNLFGSTDSIGSL